MSIFSKWHYVCKNVWIFTCNWSCQLKELTSPPLPDTGGGFAWFTPGPDWLILPTKTTLHQSGMKDWMIDGWVVSQSIGRLTAELLHRKCRLKLNMTDWVGFSQCYISSLIVDFLFKCLCTMCIVVFVLFPMTTLLTYGIFMGAGGLVFGYLHFTLKAQGGLTLIR